MEITDYLLPHEGHDWAGIFSEWTWLLPPNFTLWLVNRYGDAFLVPESGKVFMLDIGGGTIAEIAKSRDDFIRKIGSGDNANQWLMIPLVNKCVAAGLVLGPGQCYSYKVPPVLGGDYSVENTDICDLEVHYGINAQIHEQTRQVPDGTKVTI